MEKILVAYRFQTDKIHATFQISSLPDYWGDEALLNQVFSNLIGNASEYHRKNRLLVIQVEGKQLSDTVQIRIKNNGRGIRAEELEKIWKNFYRAQNASDEEGEGLGFFGISSWCGIRD